MSADELHEVWQDLTEALNENKDFWWEKLYERLNVRNRRYHNFDHLNEKYKLYCEIKHLIKNQDAMEFALFFSYYDYDPQANDFFEKNADHWRFFCEDCGIDLESDLCTETADLITSLGSHITDEHITEGVYGDEDKHYFLDLDMAILGSPPSVYREYAQKVSEEYDYLLPCLYKDLRLKVLLTFLQIPNIFATKEFRDRFEDRARQNVIDEIDIIQ